MRPEHLAPRTVAGSCRARKLPTHPKAKPPPPPREIAPISNHRSSFENECYVDKLCGANAEGPIKQCEIDGMDAMK